MKQDKRLFHFDLLRITAIIFVILLHIAANAQKEIDSFHWNTANVFNSCSRFAVPILFMISGTFFLDPTKSIPIKIIFRKYVFRIITALLFWSMCYCIVNYIIPALIAGGTISYYEIFVTFIIGHFHLWFLYTIICLYIITPLLRQITKDRNLTIYFLVLAFTFTVLMMTPLAGVLPNIAKIIQGRLNLFFVGGYSVYYVLGYYLHTSQISKRIQGAIYSLGILSVFMTIFGTQTFSIQRNELVEYLYNYLMPNVFFISVAVFILFSKVISNKAWTPSQQRIIKLISDNCFGVYLIHVFIYDSLFALGFHPLNFNPLISIPIFTIITFVTSFSLIYILSRLQIAKNYIL